MVDVSVNDLPSLEIECFHRQEPMTNQVNRGEGLLEQDVPEERLVAAVLRF